MDRLQLPWHYSSSFFREIRRIGDPNYIPLEQDVLRARLKSTGITEIRFQLGGLFIQYAGEEWIYNSPEGWLIIVIACLTLVDNDLKEESGYIALIQ